MASDVAAVEEDFKHYFVRAIEEATTTPDSGLHQFVQTSCALLLGYFLLRTVRDFANKIIDHVLLNDFPVLSSRWCIVPEGQDTSLLRERQEFYMRLACLATGLLWWLGGYLCGWEMVWCVRYIVVLYTSCQLFVVCFLLFVHGLIWVGFNVAPLTEWDRSGTGKEEGDGKGDTKSVHFDTPSTAKYRGPNMPRKHPSSVGMGRFLSSLPQGALAKANFYSPRMRKQPDLDNPELYHEKQQQQQHTNSSKHHQAMNFKTYQQQGNLEPLQPERRVHHLSDLFITREYNPAIRQTEIIIYHPITTREKFWDTSFEELRVEHYLACQNSINVQVAPASSHHSLPLITLERTPLPSTSGFSSSFPSSFTSSFTSKEAEEADEQQQRQQQQQEEEEDQTENSISDLLKSSIRQIALPFWLSSRMSRDDRTKTLSKTTTTTNASPASSTDDGESSSSSSSSSATTLVASSTPPGLPPASLERIWGRKFT